MAPTVEQPSLHGASSPSGVCASTVQPKQIPFDATEALGLLAGPAKDFISALDHYQVALGEWQTALSRSEAERQGHEVLTTEATHEILDKFAEALQACKATAQVVDRASFWRSTGFMCETTDAIDGVIQSKVAAFKTSRSWLNLVQENRSVLTWIIGHSPADQTVEQLHEGLEPSSKAQAYRNDLHAPLNEGFQVDGIRWKEPVTDQGEFSSNKRETSGIDFDDSVEERADELIE